MASHNKILLGTIVKIHGYDGTVIVKSEQRFVEGIKDMESVFIETDGKPVPFFISSAELYGDETIKMKFSGYESYEKISEFNGCRVFLTTEEEESNSAGDISRLLGFKVLLKNRKPVGTITGIINNSFQDILKITSPENQEILVPFHPDLITRIDEVKKKLFADLPGGLTEINRK